MPETAAAGGAEADRTDEDMPETSPLRAVFARLVKNREAIPLQALQTEYRKNYNALLDEVLRQADLWAGAFVYALSPPELYAGPNDKEDFALYEYHERKSNVCKQAMARGGFVEKYRAAIVDHLDIDEYEQICIDYAAAIWEVYPPYFLSHCKEKDGRVFNDLVGEYWDEDGQFWYFEWRGREPDGRRLPFILPAPPQDIRGESAGYTRKKNREQPEQLSLFGGV